MAGVVVPAGGINPLFYDSSLLSMCILDIDHCEKTRISSGLHAAVLFMLDVSSHGGELPRDA